MLPLTARFKNADLGENKVYKCTRCKTVMDRDVNGARNNLLAAYGIATATLGPSVADSYSRYRWDDKKKKFIRWPTPLIAPNAEPIGG